MKTFLAILCALTLAACTSRPPELKVEDESGNTVTVTAPPDAGKPGTVETTTEQAGVTIPAGTEVRITETEPVAATSETPAQPATRVVEFAPTKDTPLRAESKRVAASTGTVDTSVAMKKADNEAREPLLKLAAALFIVGLIVAFVLKHPVIGVMISVLGGGGALAAWKFAEVPAETWAAGVIIAFVAAAFYTRGQWDKNGNLKPDFLEKDAS